MSSASTIDTAMASAVRRYNETFRVLETKDPKEKPRTLYIPQVWVPKRYYKCEQEWIRHVYDQEVESKHLSEDDADTLTILMYATRFPTASFDMGGLRLLAHALRGCRGVPKPLLVRFVLFFATTNAHLSSRQDLAAKTRRSTSCPKSRRTDPLHWKPC